MFATGRVGHPLSRHYADLFPRWQRVEQRRIEWDVSDVDPAHRAVLRLQPQ
jgi:acyl-homoserine lactone acylase PvdQ